MKRKKLLTISFNNNGKTMTTPIHNKERQATLALLGGVACASCLPKDTPTPVKFSVGAASATGLYVASLPGNETLRATTSVAVSALGVITLLPSNISENFKWIAGAMAATSLYKALTPERVVAPTVVVVQQPQPRGWNPFRFWGAPQPVPVPTPGTRVPVGQGQRNPPPAQAQGPIPPVWGVPQPVPGPTPGPRVPVGQGQTNPPPAQQPVILPPTQDGRVPVGRR